MASSRDPVAIAIGFMFFAILQAGAILLYANFVFDARYTCDRPSDSCVIEHIRPFWRTVIEQFRPSQVVKATWVSRGKGRQQLTLEMAGGAPEIKIMTPFGGDLSNGLQEFFAKPAQPRFHLVVEWHVGYLVFSGLFQLIAIILLWATAYELMHTRGKR